MLNQLIFMGIVHPERVNFSLGQPMKMNIGSPLFTGAVNIQIQLSKVTANFELNTGKADDVTLKNYIETAVRTIMDSFGYVLGRGYDVEIYQVIRPDGSSDLFPISIPCLENRYENPEQQLILVSSLFQSRTGQYLQMAFSDFREAIRSPESCGMFCYRAIEAIRQYFVSEFQLSTENAGPSWKKLHDELGTQREDIEYLEKRSVRYRHRENVFISDEERQKVFRITTFFLDKFINYFNNQKG